MSEISILGAFLAGVLSFFSPCVLPLIPAYISYITNISIEEIKSEENQKKIRLKTIISSFLFVLGFSIVFIILGASATAIGKFTLTKFDLFKKIGGIAIILFGFNSLGIFNFKWMYSEKRFHPKDFKGNFFTPILMGMAFAFGWTPCIGPILAGILTYAGTQETLSQGIILLSVYSLGLGIPFILTGIALNSFFDFFNKIKKYFRAIEIFSGILLIIIGVLIFTDNFQYITIYLNKLMSAKL